MCSWSAWSLVTVRVSFSPTPRSTVVGAGATFEPVTVMSMVRPAGLELLLDEVEELDELDEVMLLELLVPLVPGSSPELPHAVRVRARASPTAYRRGVRGVIFVTNPSLDSAF
jgi:hypothetical protein